VNVIRTVPVTAEAPCPRVEGRERVATEFAGYLSDESRTTAAPVQAIYFPETLGHVCAAVRECASKGWMLTVTGARTGIVGGAVPVESQALLALEKLNHVLSARYDEQADAFFARVEAGVILADFQEALRTTPARDFPWADEASRCAGEEAMAARGKRLFYPVDPTETSAQIGGTVATNASGARTFHYGPTRRWVEAVTVVLASGEVAQLHRGEAAAEDDRFVLEASEGSRTTVSIPTLAMPRTTKHTAGYHLQAGMDAVDLFIGSEGTLGIVTEAELRLAPEPHERLFMTAFLPDEDAALRLVEAVRGADITPLAIEYFGPRALDLLREKRAREGASSGVPLLPDGAACAVYAELQFEGDEEFRRCYEVMEKLLRRCGTSAAETWAGLSPGDMGAMKAFRHALPEEVNGIIGRRKRDVPSLHKVGTDMAVPDERLRDVMQLYRERLAASGLEHVIFGHIGDNHLHVNILPRSEKELEQALDFYGEFAREVTGMGGSVSAEHGIGRLKREFLRIQFEAPPEALRHMQAVKNALDPSGLLNPGVLF